MKNMLSKLLEVPKHQIGGLDLLRSFATMLVFLNHSALICLTLNGTSFRNTILEFFLDGWVGIELFFVLSGYLIGHQLWQEYNESNKISYKKFLVRRIFRTWPLYFSMCLLFLFIRGPIDLNKSLPDLYFLSNYFKQNIIIGSWSLSTEEQFYFILPLVLLAGSKLKFSLRAWRIVLISLLVFAPLSRHLTLQILSKEHSLDLISVIRSLYFYFHTHYDGLIFGLLLANIKLDTKNPVRVRNCTIILVFLVPLFLILEKLNSALFRYSFIAVFFSLAVWIILHTDRFKSFFNNRLFFVLAKLSFGIYLLHYQVMKSLYPLALSLMHNLSPSTVFFIATPIFFALITSLAAISYLLIEYPGMQLRNIILKKIS